MFWKIGVYVFKVLVIDFYALLFRHTDFKRRFI